jgi:GNAT superfamily N-acetyltransferase
MDWTGYVAARLRRSNAGILVAEDDGDLVGYIDIRVVRPGASSTRGRLKAVLRTLADSFGRECPSIISPRQRGVIDDIYVVPALRCQGVGTGLLQASLQWFEQQDVSDIEAAIAVGNGASQNYFGKAGFEPVAVLVRKAL